MFNAQKDFIVKNPEYIEIGKNFKFSYSLRLDALSGYDNQVFSPVIKIGNNVNLNNDVHNGCTNEDITGDNKLIVSRVFISDHRHDYVALPDIKLSPNLRRLISKDSVIMSKNVWICDGVSILSSATIGNNVIIGANALVTKKNLTTQLQLEYLQKL